LAHVNRKQYWQIFVALTVLTALEVGLVYIPGISKVLMGIGLCTLAIVKATLVGLYYMHLGHETKQLKLSVAIPMTVPAFYAFVLIAEAAWRLV
jgi:caa(3)-type oxidase subunit IV